MSSIHQFPARTNRIDFWPTLIIGLAAALTYIALAQFGYQIRILTADNGRICLIWPAFAASVLMYRSYKTPALIGIAAGAFVAGISSPLTAPATAVTAAIANVWQVTCTLAALKKYESHLYERHQTILLTLRVALYTSIAAAATLSVSAAEAQRTWNDVVTATVYWSVGDIGTAFAIWAALRCCGFRLFERQRISARQRTDLTVQQTSQLCARLLRPVWGARDSIFGVSHWIGDWVDGQRSLHRAENDIRMEAIEHLVSEVASELPTCTGLISSELRDQSRRILSAMARQLVRIYFWIFHPSKN